MNKILAQIAAVFTALVLLGCASQPQEAVVYKTRYVVITLDDRYLEPTKVPALADPTAYAPGQEVDWEQEYIKLNNTAIDLYAKLGACNSDKRQAKIDLNQKQAGYAQSR